MSYNCIFFVLILCLYLFSEIQCQGEYHIIIILLYKLACVIDVGYIGDCKYWHYEVPRSSNHTGCSITEGSAVYLTCAIYHPCDIIVNVRWYKSVTEMEAEEDVIRGNGQHIMSSNKYFLIPQNTVRIVNNGNFYNCCSTSLVLFNNNFNYTDNGYYWCQFVAYNHLLLLPPYGYISLSEGAGSNSQACTVYDLTRQLDPAECAENTTRSHSGRMSCASQTTTDIVTPATNTDSTQSRSITVTETKATNAELYSSTTVTEIRTPLSETTQNISTTDRETTTPSSKLNSSLTVTNMTTESYESGNYASGTVQEEPTSSSGPTNYISETTPKENNSLLYGAIVGACVCFSIVLLLVVMCFVIAIYKYRKLEKKSK